MCAKSTPNLICCRAPSATSHSCSGKSTGRWSCIENDLARNPLDLGHAGLLSATRSAPPIACSNACETRLSLLQLHPEFGGINSSVGIARLYLGQFDAALEFDATGNLTRTTDWVASRWYIRQWDNAPSRMLRCNSLTEKFASIDSYGIAAVHAYRGEIDDAFRWLDRAYREHAYGMLVLKTDPLLRNLHGDPRFAALLNRMRLTDPPQRADIQDLRFSIQHLACFTLGAKHGIEKNRHEKGIEQTAEAETVLKLSRKAKAEVAKLLTAQSGRNYYPGEIGYRFEGSRTEAEEDDLFRTSNLVAVGVPEPLRWDEPR